MNNPKQLAFPWNKINKSSLSGFYTSKANLELITFLRDKNFSDDLFIYGATNSGKTYLLQAICNEYSSLDKTSFYVPLKHAIGYGTEILESLENIDLICIDGIEAVISDKLWERAIFNLINRAFSSKSRLILTSSSSLESLNFLLPDLESRIRRIQSYELYSIDDTEIYDALNHISNIASIKLGEKEAKYLITYSKRDISNLVEVLESLDKLSLELKRKISIPLIKELI